MIRSIRWRLFASFAAIALIAIAIVGAMAAFGMRDEFSTYVRHSGMGCSISQGSLMQRVQSAFLQDNFGKNGWSNTQTAVEQLASCSGSRVAVVDATNKLIADSQAGTDRGKNLDELIPHALLISNHLQGTVYTAFPGGKDIMGGMGLNKTSAQTPEGDYLTAVSRYLLLAAILACAAAFLLAFLISRRITQPVENVIGAVEKMTHGQLAARATVEGNDELARLGQAVNIMAANLERNETLRKNMIADIAHELRTPIATLRGYLEGFQDGVIEPTKEKIDTLHEETLALGDLVANLQELSIADAGELRLNIASIEADRFLATQVEKFRPRFDQNHITLKYFTKNALPIIQGDELRLAQVLKNVLENALHYTPEGGSVTVTAEKSFGNLVVRISDTGHGIDPQSLPLIFERFYRADPSRARTSGGSGLGLTIAKRLIEAHGGQITADSALEKGTSITILLPVSP